MFKHKLILIAVLALISILFLVTDVLAVRPAAPVIVADNFGGPIRITWNNVLNATSYDIYRVDSDSAPITSDPLPYPYTGFTKVASRVAPDPGANTTYYDVTTADATDYWYFVVSYNNLEVTPNTESAFGSNVFGVKSAYVKLILTANASNSTISYENPSSEVINPSTSTLITYTLNGGFLAKKITYDIKYKGDTTIFKEPPVISSYTGISGGTISWDGSWFNTEQPTKHNGSYSIEITPTGFDDQVGDTVKISVNVNVVHINDILKTYTDIGSNPLLHAGPYKFSYQLTMPAQTTVSIWDTKNTTDITDDTLVKTLTDNIERDGEGPNWDLRWEIVWDIKDNNGLKVPHGIYRYQIDAYRIDNRAANYIDNALTRGDEFTYDFAIVDVVAAGITPSNSLAKISYTLTDSGTTKIQICTANTTFTLDSNGDPVPVPSTNLVKTLSFSREAGAHEETWDGLNETGRFMENGIYKFVVSAKDVDGNHAIDATDNDFMVIGEFTIDRTASQVSTDSTPPTVTSVTPANGTILGASFTEVSAVLQDNTGGTGVDLVGSTITLTDPAGNSVTGTQSNNGTDTIKLTFASQDTSGTYTIRITPKDLGGNTGSQATYTFSLNTTAEEVDFKESVFVYPNPVKRRNATFAYSLTGNATVTIEVYTIMGEKVWSKVIYDIGSGDKRVNWRCINNDGEVLADELYIYKITAEYSNGNTRNATKKLIISK